ncbi:retroelement polyprotein-like [Gossypium australe]|uniref:Retroelement polyprotein-like n=1 Tax=Gossypium australe TaxID=47621 RepID=A0A5B6WTI9_9ROSI|nr:retroelement polyprotein-like [Gossypium australe]
MKSPSYTKKRPNDGMTTKFFHDNLFLDNKLKLFPGKLKSQWSSPFEVVQVYPHRAIEVKDEKMGLLSKSMASTLRPRFVGLNPLVLLATF